MLGHRLSMRIYRLEFLSDDGYWTGPYRTQHATTRAQALRNEMWYKHVKEPCKLPQPNPAPLTDHAGCERFVCGCPGMAALRRWFGNYLDAFMDEGASVGIYEVPDAA